MGWIYLVIAGMLEISFGISIKLMDGHKNITWSIIFYISIIMSFVFLSLALKEVPLGTAYAVWTGIGAFGVAVAGIVLFGESYSLLRIVYLLLLIISIIGLKMTGK